MKKFFITAFAFACFIQPANAHGIAGDRVFPATLAIDDPAVSDELTLPQVNRVKDDKGWATETDAEFSKRITKDFALSIGGAYVDGDEAKGWDNVELGAKYQFLKNDEHEMLASFGLNWDIGQSGSSKIGESFSTLTPAVLFGKGFGDVGGPTSLIRPFAVTGSLDVAMPTDRHTDGETNPNILQWGLTLQYSLPYLQQHVKDVGLPQPFSQIVPVVEFAMGTPLDGDDQRTTGTINPGFIWSNQDMQFGLEAVIPVNNSSGDGVGVRAQMHFFFDDMFPHSLGKPIW